MKEKEKEKELLELVKKMSQNRYLLPSSWSEEAFVSGKQEKYRTYRNGNDYFAFEYQFENYERIKITCSLDSNRITVDNFSIFSFTSNIQNKVEYIIKTIYAEKHSFKDYAEGVVALRKKIDIEKEKIQSAQKLIARYNEEIEDCLKLQRENITTN